MMMVRFGKPTENVLCHLIKIDSALNGGVLFANVLS